MPGFDMSKGNQAAQNRLKSNKERADSDSVPMPDARRVPINKIRPNPFQVRQDFDSPEAQQALKELADDIRNRDILEPLVVRLIEENGTELYEIIAGERRFRAAKMLGKTILPVIIKENWTEMDARLASLAENLQRRDLTLKEEVLFFLSLENEYRYTAKEISKYVNKSESYVSRRLRLARDPQKLEEMNSKGLSLTEMLLMQDEQVVKSETAPLLPDNISPIRPKETAQATKIPGAVKLLPYTRFKETLNRTTKLVEKGQVVGEDRENLLLELEAIEDEIADLRNRLARQAYRK